MTTPGIVEIHQYPPVMNDLPLLMMAPHSGVFGGTPRPRKLMEAAVMMHMTMSEAA